MKGEKALQLVLHMPASDARTLNSRMSGFESRIVVLYGQILIP